MPILEKPLPDNPQKLKSIINNLCKEITKRDKKIKTQTHSIEYHESSYKILKEQYLYLKQKLFGQSSEKSETLSLEQKDLFFNEAEAFDKAEPVDLPGVEVKSYQRKKRGRKPIPDSLPREEIIHDVSEQEKVCACCGKQRPSIGEEIREELKIIPEQLKVLKHVIKKYGACKCEASFEQEQPEVIQAQVPARLIPGSIASASILAYSITSKFNDGLPFYRQSAQYKRHGLEISRATLCNWSMLVAEKINPLMDILWADIKEAELIQMDETKLQVLKEPEKSASSQSYMWVSKGRSQGQPIILYYYAPSRSGEVPKKLLAEYSGYLQTDDYKGYNEIARDPNIIQVGCWAHVRRKYFEAQKVTKVSGLADEAIRYIQEIYKIEKAIQQELAEVKITPTAFMEKRKKRLLPIFKVFRRWLNKNSRQVPAESLIGKAISYTLNNWDKLIRYIDEWYITPDNNGIENAIRPFVVGRKNWLFSNTPRGAQASANLYSLIETAKANGLEPFHYLNYLFDKLPLAKSQEEFRRLLPTKVKPQDI